MNEERYEVPSPPQLPNSHRVCLSNRISLRDHSAPKINANDPATRAVGTLPAAAPPVLCVLLWAALWVVVGAVVVIALSLAVVVSAAAALIPTALSPAVVGCTRMTVLVIVVVVIEVCVWLAAAGLAASRKRRDAIAPAFILSGMSWIRSRLLMMRNCQDEANRRLRMISKRRGC